MKKMVLIVLFTGVAALSDGSQWYPLPTIVVAKRSFRNQIGPIPETTIFVPKSDGDFRASIYLEAAALTAPPPNNEVVVTVAWKDDFREGCGDLDISGPVSVVSDSTTTVIHAVANQPIFVSGNPTACVGSGTTNTTDSYNAFITLEALP